MDYFSKLKNKIKTKKAIIGIVGIGYVGESLAMSASSSGFKTYGFDIDKAKIAKFNSQNHIRFQATDNTDLLSKCDIICICVPTPVNKDGSPNLKFIESASVEIANHLRGGQLIITESSVSPGTTRNFIRPILARSKLRLGVEFFLGYSPERIDPGNKIWGLENTPKVVSGIDENSKLVTCEFYSSFVSQVVPVSSVEVAELTKVFENVFRLVNISLVNEIADFTKAAGINVWEMIAAASTKPYGFLAHFPGPGVGGECIPVLPLYLLDNAKKRNVSLKLVKAAVEVNREQPKKVVDKTLEVLNGKKGKNGESPNVLLIGLSYKEETGDIRESAALKIWEMLEQNGVAVSYHDPYVSHVNGFSSKNLRGEFLNQQDVIIITTGHKNIDYNLLINSKKPVIDTKNILKEFANSNILRI